MHGRRQTGFTLIELILVILITGILAGVLFTILRGPIQSSLDVQQRTELVGVAETALQRMSREVRLALPNSVRVSGGSALEFLRTVDGGRYRAAPPPGNRVLRFNDTTQGTNGTFEVLGGLPGVDAGSVMLATLSPASGEADCRNGTTDCMVVYNTGQNGADAYAGDNVAAIEEYDSAASELRFRRASSGFPFESPRQRFHVVDTPVSYVCAGNAITRYDEYDMQSAQPVPPGVGGNLLVDRVSACTFTYDPGTSTRAGLLTFSITISDGGQDITLLQQVQVENLP